MIFRSRFQSRWIPIVVAYLALIAFVIYPVPSLYAQDEVNGEVNTENPTTVDDADLTWDESTVPYVEKPDGNIIEADDEKKVEEEKVEQFEYSLFLPSAGSAGTDLSAQAAATPAWRT